MKGTVAVIEGRGCNYWRGQCHGNENCCFGREQLLLSVLPVGGL